ncbi:MFS transporter [Salimicrobium halophilum]|uniref:Major Facilitator Superfamily protein n=1 Tax=Salimicrobium halophilum TaxID=86666 RepID=A0A1G8UDC0_9BACI|nr:MFS transporter [Salimicrobium halophilum]SDJ50990.1 Major Facilitator Superfamily protein [Salimicrobium halophilum]
MKRNIRFIYLYIFLAQLFFDRALWVIYLNEQGMSMTEIGVIEALMHLSVVLLEVPTGIIADLYGRKVSLFIGNVMSIGYGTFMLVGDSFSLFGLALVTLGVSVTFQSGAEEALAYDTLKEYGEEKKYTSIMGNMIALALISLSIAKLLGGWLAEIDFTYVYAGVIISHIAALVPIFFLHEPPREKPEKMSIREQWLSQLKTGTQVWKKHPSIHVPIVFFVSLGAVAVIIVFYGQEYFVRLGLSPLWIGAIFTVEGLIGAWMAKMAYKLEEKWSFFSITKYGYLLFLLFFILFIWSPVWGIVGSFLILCQLLTLYEPIFSNFIQNRLNSSIRATFFSMISVVESFVTMLTFPLFGWIIDIWSFETGFLGMLGLLAALYVWQSSALEKNRHQLT